MTNLDCPLCGEKQAIVYVSSNREIIMNPGPEGLLGNYHFEYTGGNYDYSHSHKCSFLVNAFQKESLLMYFIEKENLPVILADSLSFDDYQENFKNLFLEIIVKLIRKGLSWRTEMYLKLEKDHQGEKYFLTEAANPEKAFSLFRHRILCGEVSESKHRGNSRFQFKVENKKIEICYL